MNFRKMLSVLMVIVICVSLFSGCGEKTADNNLTTTVPTANGRSISLVTYNENSGFYTSLKKGAEDAAKKYGFALNYVGLDDTAENNLSFHFANLERTLDSDASGVVITPMGEGYSEILSRFFDEKIPVVLIDSIDDDDIERLESINKNPIASTVSTSYKDAGAVCAEKMFEKVKEQIKKTDGVYLIGVIERENSDIDEEKADGFVERFTELADADEGTKGKYKIETESENVISDALSQLVKEKVSAVFLTHPHIVDSVSDIVFADKGAYKDIVFCGFDSGAKQLNWLNSSDTAEFIGAFAQDSYNLGYNAVEQCIFAIQSKEVKSEIKVDGKWYDKTNSDKMKQDNMIFEK